MNTILPPNSGSGFLQRVLIRQQSKTPCAHPGSVSGRGRSDVPVLSLIGIAVLTAFRLSRDLLQSPHQLRQQPCPVYWRHEPNCGDVVAIRFSDPGKLSMPTEMLMKRIHSLCPAKPLSFAAGVSHINGELLKPDRMAKYLLLTGITRPSRSDQTNFTWIGDNRSMHFAYHMQGRAAAREHIIGRVLL